ncbi:hypothetical protein AC520_1217 [Enterobacter sp. OLF]|nr:hypothetical protein AC520_1217 [Enterobacter sp. OLF]
MPAAWRRTRLNPIADIHLFLSCSGCSNFLMMIFMLICVHLRQIARNVAPLN